VSKVRFFIISTGAVRRSGEISDQRSLDARRHPCEGRDLFWRFPPKFIPERDSCLRRNDVSGTEM